jgi:hypothetical protein
MNEENPKQCNSREWHGIHLSWNYRPHAFRWNGEKIEGINFFPAGREMRAWLTQQCPLAIAGGTDNGAVGGYTNPYTAYARSLAAVTSRVVNAFHQYATTPTPDHDAFDAEIERIRLYNEVVLYLARFCEVVIKQLLYCTQIPEKTYGGMALGALLESWCSECKKQNGKEPHLISMVGSLAHPYRLCLEFDHCAMNHLDLVNKLRNSQAAHSGIQALNVRTVEESKLQLLKDCSDILDGYVHMLSHVESLETRMLDDLAQKGGAITLLKLKGLPASECNFALIPGEPFFYPTTPPQGEILANPG